MTLWNTPIWPAHGGSDGSSSCPGRQLVHAMAGGGVLALADTVPFISIWVIS
ncbi:hypothetical protein E2C01_096654 [Portunus trituberculatus]|uniref:Uncharacterized protein n=1 Tax=Portunus trituberculatus TaxID=210409 RepID=A0A5B7K2B2_PORTR|nr:hypothetical protein [Portunus trituberculatus]